ncbi:MAG: DUF4249 family protein [Salinivirgaceae bacterium]|nr:DUF4249 family protein [Salinivirgaceae bacterium]
MKIILFAIIIISISSCIEEYNYENFVQDEKVLVIDGQILTNEVYQTVKISWTTSPNYPVFNPVTNCLVFAEDMDGNLFNFEENAFFGNGIYRAEIPIDYLYFGNKFRLFVETPDGKKFQSSFEELKACVAVDTITYDYLQNNNKSQDGLADGIKFNLNMKNQTGFSEFYRVMVNESWEYHTPWPIEKYVKISYKGLSVEQQPPDYSKQICYRSLDLKNIYTVSFNNVSAVENITKQLHAVTTETQRLKYRYSLLISQFSLTQQAYLYWEDLRKASQVEEGIFGKTPINVKGNINCVTDADVVALGYFGVSDVTTKRFFYNDIPEIEFYPFQFGCTPNEVIEKSFWATLGRLDKDDLPYYIPLNPSYDPTGYYLANQTCFDCRTAGGSLSVFDFWTKK